MAKVIFEFTEHDALSNDKPGHTSAPVNISVSMTEINDGRPGHSECLALILKQNASEILNVINEVYIMKLKESGTFEINTDVFKIHEKRGDKKLH